MNEEQIELTEPPVAVVRAELSKETGCDIALAYVGLEQFCELARDRLARLANDVVDEMAKHEVGGLQRPVCLIFIPQYRRHCRKRDIGSRKPLDHCKISRERWPTP